MKQQLFIGTYSEPIVFGTGEILQGKGEGIYLYSFDSKNGKFSEGQLLIESRNPSFLCVSEDKKYLYAVNELKEYAGEVAGSVSAYRILQRGTEFALKFLNRQSTLGTDPCHISINRSGTQVYVANFMSGSVSAYLVEDGELTPPSKHIQHQGSSIDSKRQAGPHAHSVVLTPDERYALVPDLGIDKLMVYKTDFETGTLIPASIPYFELTLGDGPRFCEFHPDQITCYLINELASSLSVLKYDAAAGAFTRNQVISTIPEDFTQDNICADVHVTPDGKYVYASNRGHDSIAIFAVGQDGQLALLDIVSCCGRTPRNFTISECGNYIIVANQDSDNLVSFAIDGQSGLLTKQAEVFAPTPVCVRPYKLDR